MKKMTTATSDQKRYSEAAAAVHKLNGHVTPDVALIQGCGQKLRELCPLSCEEFTHLPRRQRNAVRNAVKSALELKSSPADTYAFGQFKNLLAQAENPMGALTNRAQLARMFRYFASTVL